MMGVRIWHGYISALEVFTCTAVLAVFCGRLGMVVGISRGEYYKGKGKRRRGIHVGGTFGHRPRIRDYIGET